MNEYKIKRVFSIHEVFKPLPWYVRDVIPILRSDGEPIAYCEVDGHSRLMRELPCEIFNHELKRINVLNVEEFASFLYEYGLVGCFEKNRELFSSSLLKLDISDRSQVLRFEADMDFLALLPKNPSDYFISRQEIETRYSELQEGIACVAKDHKVLSVVSAAEAATTVWSLLSSAKTVKAIMQSDDPETIAKLADISVDGLYDEIQEDDEYLNWLMRGISPQIGIVIDMPDGTCGKPSFDDLILEYKRGCFEQAVALQIWEFSLHGEGYSVCSECGEVFVRKRSTNRNGSPRNTSLFCCDKCKNRYTQRKYRKSPAYQLKQEKKKASKPSSSNVIKRTS